MKLKKTVFVLHMHRHSPKEYRRGNTNKNSQIVNLLCAEPELIPNYGNSEKVFPKINKECLPHKIPSRSPAGPALFVHFAQLIYLRREINFVRTHCLRGTLRRGVSDSAAGSRAARSWLSAMSSRQWARGQGGWHPSSRVSPLPPIPSLPSKALFYAGHYI